MEVASCVQAVVNSASAYQSNPSDINEVQLQRQLDVLISLTSRISSLSFFNTKELLPTECVSCLVDIMDRPHTKSSLAQKIMLMLENLANKRELRNALHSTYNLTSCLARFLKLQRISAADPNTLLCLKLLHKITYECKVSFQEAYIEDLVHFLIEQIQAKEDELTLPCVGLLANLCRHNLPVQMIVKNQENVKSFYQQLANFLKHSNNRLVVCALSALISLCFNEEISKKIFSTKNIAQIFQLLFSILMKSDGGTTLRCTVDVFIDLIKHEKIQRLLTVYDHLDAFLSQLLTLLQKGQAEDISKLLELLLSLCSVTGIRCVVCRRLLETTLSPDTSTPRLGSGRLQLDSFQAVIHWAGQSVDTHTDAPLLAFDFLKEMYEEILDQGLLATASPRTEHVLPVIMTTLSACEIPEGPTGRKHCLKLTKAIQLALVLASDSSLCPLVGAAVSTQQCMSLLEHQFHNNAVGLKGMRWMPSGDADDWSEDGAGIVLYTLDLMLALKNHVPNMEVQICILLQDPRLVSYLSHGVTSGIRDHVHIVLKVVSKGSVLPEFPTTMLGDCIAAQMSQQQARTKAHTDRMEVTPCTSYPPRVISWDKENIPIRGPRAGHGAPRGRNAPPASDASVDSLIEKMQNGLELKDARASEIISIYEHKLQSLQTKESHLQDLLEAKTLAMAQADRLITQYRCRMARNEAEAQELRCLLQEWEKRSEDYREQLNEAMLDQERLSNDVEQMAQDNARLEAIAEEHRELTEAYTEQTQKLENSQRALITLKQEHHSLTEMHEMLRRHNDTLKQQHDVASEQLIEMEEERKILSKQTKEKDAKLQELNKAFLKSEKELKKMTKERDGLETAIDKLRENLYKSEQAKKELHHQVSSLELVCRQHETSIKEKVRAIEDLQENVEKHNKIAALIHNITSGKDGDK